MPFDAKTINAAIDAARLKTTAYFYPEIGSTNTEALRLAGEGAAAWTAVVADCQTAGRGRAGRAWRTPPGQSIALSVILRPEIDPADLPRLTMLGAVSTMRALRRWVAKAELGLKWPNDVLLQRRKVAGILPEARFWGDRVDAVVLGVGLNVSTDFGDAPDLAQSAISLVQATQGQPFSRVEVLVELLLRLEQDYPRLSSRLLFREWQDALVTLGRPVTVTTPAGEVHGFAESVDAHGALWVRADDGARRRFVAGDVTLREKTS